MNEYIKREAAAKRVAFELMYEAAIAMNLSYKELVEIEASKQERIKMHVRKWLEQEPSADVIEVRHGHWIGGNNSLAARCSVCGNWGQRHWNYCPNCGARMRMTKEQYESHVGDIYEDGENDE